MLSRLQADYQRLEQSLQRLTDSIAAYNPSPAAAEELVAADEAITEDLNLLSIHQSNHARLEELRQTASSLDTTLKSTIQLLADTRREIKAVPVYNGNQDNALPVDRLLAYAKFISKTSVPPTRRAIVVPEPVIKEEPDTKAAPTNGTTSLNGDAVSTENIGMKSLDEQVKRMLDPLKEMAFEPWPPYNVIQQGALADIQRLIDAGTDPASILSATEQAEADRLKAEEEEREKVEEEARQQRRMSMFPGGGRPAAQDDVFDPDEA